MSSSNSLALLFTVVAGATACAKSYIGSRSVNEFSYRGKIHSIMVKVHLEITELCIVITKGGQCEYSLIR